MVTAKTSKLAQILRMAGFLSRCVLRQYRIISRDGRTLVRVPLEVEALRNPVVTNVRAVIGNQQCDT
jgi:hypothetical protein